MNLARARELGISRQIEPSLRNVTHFSSPAAKAIRENGAALPSPVKPAVLAYDESPAPLPPSAAWEPPPGFVLDLANWQSQLEPLLAPQLLCKLRLPGTHDSGAYALSRRHMAPSKLPGWLLGLNKRASWLTRPFTRLVVRWGEAQRLDIYQQLCAGARYLDVRVVNVKGVFHVAHGMLGTTTDDVLAQVARFLDEHAGEVVVVDCNHFHKFKGRADHEAFIASLTAALGRHLAGRDAREDATFGALRAAGRRCVLLYGGADYLGVAGGAAAAGCWPRTEREIVSPWPRAGSLKKLLARLPALDAAAGRARGLYVLQGVVTPCAPLVRRGLFARPSSLRQLAQRVTPEVVRLVVAGVLEARCVILLDHIELGDVAQLLLSAYLPAMQQPLDAAAREEAAKAVAAAAAEDEGEEGEAEGEWLDGAEAVDQGLRDVTHLLQSED